jgi:hypothetical protein
MVDDFCVAQPQILRLCRYYDPLLRRSLLNAITLHDITEDGVIKTSLIGRLYRAHKSAGDRGLFCVK